MDTPEQHLMYDEICEEPELLRRLLSDQPHPGLRQVAEWIRATVARGGEVFLVGSGSSFNACSFAKSLFALRNKLLVETVPGGEFINYASLINDKSLVIFVS